jgi:hypothetical protein
MSRRGLWSTSKVWECVDKVVIKVINSSFHSYQCILTTTTRASQALVSKIKEESIGYVNQTIGIDKSIEFTLNPIYLEFWTKLMQQKD